MVMHIRYILSIISCASILYIQASDNLPAGFGSTHFIVGVPSSQIQQQQKKGDQNLLLADAIIDILFSPDDDLCMRLVTLIDKEMTSIKVAIFLLTDERIAQALLNAKQRGVQVEVVVDPKHMYDRFSRVDMMCRQGMCVYVFNPKYADTRGVGLLHTKFVIFGTSGQSTSVVWTGSFNFTRVADGYNQEQVLVVQGSQAVRKFSEHFEKLKQRSSRHVASNTAVAPLRSNKHQ
jgi:cardiolipin hydrolase